MKLQSIDTFVVGNPPPAYGGRYFIFVKLSTACGITGIGEIYAATFGPHLIAQLAEDMFARHFCDQDPHQIERFWHRAHGAGYNGRPDTTVMGVFSGLEMACWDIIGKAAGRPVYDLLGGKVHDRLRTYTYLYPDGGYVYPDPDQPNVYNDPDMAAEQASRMVDLGFTAVKFDPAGPYGVFDGHQPNIADLERSELFCCRIREAVGDRADLLFGTHGQFTTSGARRMAKRLEAYEPLWFEEPVPPDMPEQMAAVAQSTSVPIATGERLCTRYEFQRVLALEAASILQMNLGRVGGLLEAKKIAALAEAHYAEIAPHLYCGPVVGAANIQIAACSPNFLILESIETWQGFHSDILRSSIRWEDGYVIPPTEPGLGVELNEDVARAHQYMDNALHLESATDPVGWDR